MIESAVTDLANDLKDRFDWAMYQSQEAYVVLPDGKSFERANQTARRSCQRVFLALLVHLRFSLISTI